MVKDIKKASDDDLAGMRYFTSASNGSVIYPLILSDQRSRPQLSEVKWS